MGKKNLSSIGLDLVLLSGVVPPNPRMHPQFERLRDIASGKAPDLYLGQTVKGVREGGAAQRSPLSVRVVTRLAGGAPPTSFLLPSATQTRPGGADSLSLSQRISETQSFPISAVSDENRFHCIPRPAIQLSSLKHV